MKIFSKLMSAGVLLFFIIILTNCGRQIDSLKANSHFKSANALYIEEKYKKAAMEYEEALKLNPNMKIAYVYIGTAYNQAYKAAILPPEKDEEYKKKKQGLPDLRSKIEENNRYISTFERDPMVTEKLAEIQKLEKAVTGTRDSIEIIPGYTDYLKDTRDLESVNRRLAETEKFILDIETRKKEGKKIEKDENEVYLKKLQDKEELTTDKQALEKNLQNLNFESSPEYNAKKQEIERLKNSITSCENALKGKSGYDEYLRQLKEKDLNNKQLMRDTAYVEKAQENEIFRQKSIDFLLQAKSAFPDNQKIIMALADCYDKQGEFAEAEKYYKLIMENKKDDPKSYYILAEFYSKNQKDDEAETMYKKRIALDPKDPSGYHHYIGYLESKMKLDLAIENHEKRIACMIDPSLLDMYQEIDKIREKLGAAEKKQKYIDNIKINKAIPAAQKKELLDQSEKELSALGGSPDTLKAQIDSKLKLIEPKLKAAEANISSLSQEKKQELSEAFYGLGYSCWAKSYKTPPEQMGDKERETYLNKGFAALQKSIEIVPDYPNPYSYIGLMYREKIKIDPLRKDEYVKKNEEYNAKFIDIYKKKRSQDEYKKSLEKMEEK